MTIQQYEQSEDEYSMDEAVMIITQVIERKGKEIAQLEAKCKRLKNADKIEANKALVAFIEADMKVYQTVLADMKDDDSYLEGIDTESDPVPQPENYQDYIDGLSAEDLQNEMDAESVRADYCDGIIEDMCSVIGKKALKSKKMVKALLEDPYALEQIGEVIFYDDYLFDLFRTIMEQKALKKAAKKKGE